MKNTESLRLQGVEESSTLAMAALAREYKAKGVDVISLSLGEPDFKTPTNICEGAKEAIDSGKYFSYPPVPGYLDFREAISEKFKNENGLNYSPSEIIVSNGVKHSITNVMFSILNPGDEVIVFAPFWVSYSAIISLADGIPKYINTTIKNDFKPTNDQLEEAISTKTKAIIFSSPCNPTGTVFTKEELEGYRNILVNHPDIYVISDEIYEHINFTDEHASFGSLEGMNDRTITMNGFSKGFAMTGWRLGYIGAPIVWLMGVCKEDMFLVGQLLGEKTVLNEFVAYVSLGEMKTAGMFFQEKSVIMATYILCGFANFASIGIQIGGIGALAPKRKSDLSKLGVLALLAGTLASLFTAVIVGMIL